MWLSLITVRSPNFSPNLERTSRACRISATHSLEGPLQTHLRLTPPLSGSTVSSFPPPSGGWGSERRWRGWHDVSWLFVHYLFPTVCDICNDMRLVLGGEWGERKGGREGEGERGREKVSVKRYSNLMFEMGWSNYYAKVLSWSIVFIFLGETGQLASWLDRAHLLIVEAPPPYLSSPTVLLLPQEPHTLDNHKFHVDVDVYVYMNEIESKWRDQPNFLSMLCFIQKIGLGEH